jgi:hypothetical protein
MKNLRTLGLILLVVCISSNYAPGAVAGRNAAVIEAAPTPNQQLVKPAGEAVEPETKAQALASTTIGFLKGPSAVSGAAQAGAAQAGKIVIAFPPECVENPAPCDAAANFVIQAIEAASNALKNNGYKVYPPTEIRFVNDNAGTRAVGNTWYVNNPDATGIRTKLIQSSLVGAYPGLSYYAVEGFAMYLEDKFFGTLNNEPAHRWNSAFADKDGADIGDAAAAGNTQEYNRLMAGCGNNAIAIAQSLKRMALTISHKKAPGLIKTALALLNRNGRITIMEALLRSTQNENKLVKIRAAFRAHGIEV